MKQHIRSKALRRLGLAIGVGIFLLVAIVGVWITAYYLAGKRSSDVILKDSSGLGVILTRGPLHSGQNASREIEGEQAVARLPDGTRAIVIDRVLIDNRQYYKVRVREGPSQGVEGWLQQGSVQFEVAWF
jgi:hypothetical protein